MPSGLFVVLEGVEGAGKSTQARLLSRWLEEEGIAHTATREPGGTALGEAVRALVLDRTDLALPAEAELLLVVAARTAFVREVVAPVLERGEVVVSDRYELSTLAYQGWGRGLDLDAVRRINAFATGGVAPDLCLVLDVPVEEGVARQRRQGKGGDRIEQEGEGFLGRVREGYLALARSEEGVRLVDATGTADAVHERVKEILRAEFPETFRPRTG